ncbi:MerR family DNA-binding transcriptional regulator [Enterococcus raffinosus]|jgi:DNA-binding transcriptional MerR regulator/effector-binding domain-containing protein|uniref:MerR family transcriptional regulator n=1 Tax=Enterococcus raffinosus TaxID=71452 RepID=A0AAP5KEM1_9ENTE|nr:MerR family DNA-binding transcriptional regulator [Enterococcus raffinosus]MDT2525571.1 MerR family transcriptional regulator [Enterococcus raffinosus]MDT2531787.1 MerR family transcriptional regulator [Enterococcus raffinosus]MDT2536086.1 MerR family transcriptional regulator [Enterococcus raffinosus]MDT2546586.1 MerR family transcriptional regulator [Enterococcus raffinosus]MDT2556933.1 MerR family transcriptional regulator [Enterococcus raffinosus]
MKELLTISEMAKYAGISRRTLIYYDQIDLFKPAKVGENGYRYYGIDQYFELDVILLLKNLDVSLEDIHVFLKNRNVDYVLDGFIRQKQKVNEQINKLNGIRDSLDSYIERYTTLKNFDLESITLSYREAESFVISETIENYDINSVQIYGRFYSSVESRDLFSGYPIGFLVDGSAFYQENFHTAPYRALVKISEDRLHIYDQQRVVKRPAGYYVSGFMKDEIHHINTFNNRFRNYLKENKLELNGDIWELLWQDETTSEQPEDQVFEVLIPVQYKEGK